MSQELMEKFFSDLKCQKRHLLRQRRGEPKEPWDKFYEYLMLNSTILPNTPNWEASALFAMIQLAFDGTTGGKPVTINPYLAHNLAACCCVALQYDKKDKIPWDTSEHDGIIERTYTGFAHTVIDAIQQEEIREMEGKVYFGYLHIPQWFVTWAKEKAVRWYS